MPLTLPFPLLRGLEDAERNFDELQRRWPSADTATALPPSPFDGQLIAYEADATNGVIWLLRYNASSASAYKWEFLGGAWLATEQTATALVTSATYADLNGGTPALTLPLGGDWDLVHGARLLSASATADIGYQTLKVGAETAADTYAVLADSTAAAGTEVSSGVVARRVTAINAGDVAKCQYKSLNRAMSVESRWLRALPVRVG